MTGDSIIARQEGKNEPHLNWNLQQLLPEIELENTAVSGINSGAFFAKLNELVLSVKQCDNLVILLGTNDLAITNKCQQGNLSKIWKLFPRQ